MNFLLKIVEGPNKGAEIALVEGVAVTLGKGDACDIVLADPTMPDAPSTIEASAAGVTLDGAPVEPFHVRTLGATSFAVGPADAPWGGLVWPEPEQKEPEPAADGAEEAGAPPPAADPAPKDRPAEAPAPAKRLHGCLGCLAALVVLLAAFALLFAYLRGRPQGEGLWCWTTNTVSGVCERRLDGNSGRKTAAGDTLSLPEVIARHGLSESGRSGRKVLVGDFATRAERLAATAEAYAAQPGVEIDFADAESLKGAVADTLALVGEADLSVTAVTGRVAVLSGTAVNLRRTLEAVSADVPKLANVDVADVSVLHVAAPAASEPAPAAPRPAAARAAETRGAPPAASLPVCGILVTPYPCIVLKNGTRILEGATVGDWTIVKVEEDSVTVTNSTGRFTWRP